MTTTTLPIPGYVNKKCHEANKIEKQHFWNDFHAFYQKVDPKIVNLIMNGGSCYQGRRQSLSGIIGGNYYWYLRAVVITGIVGGNYYWHLRAEILQCRVAFVGWVVRRNVCFPSRILDYVNAI